MAAAPATEAGGRDHLVVWYNTRCPVCDAGINRQRQRLVRREPKQDRHAALSLCLRIGFIRKPLRTLRSDALVEAVKAGRVEFRDINLEPEALAGYGASLEDVRRRLHAIDVGGRLLVGADVAIAVWAVTPGEKWLARLLGNPVVRPMACFAYDRFADILYAWNRRKGHW